MGDPRDPRAMSFSLPPGCRFHPSHQLLLCHYLTNKNTDVNSNPRSDGSVDGYDLIKELELYNYDPFDLPDTACFPYGCGGRKRHWYCYTVKVAGESKETKRRTKSGYWRRRGKAKDVVGSGGKTVGTRMNFVFCLGNSPRTSRTQWVMHEYSLLDHKASFVLCRVFAKSRAGNSISDNGLSSCAEESVPTLHRTGIQLDGDVTPDTVETKMQDDNPVDRNTEMPTYPGQLIRELEQVMTAPLYVPSFPFPSGLQPRELVSSPVLPQSGAIFSEALTEKELACILEEDFIELDDLMC